MFGELTQHGTPAPRNGSANGVAKAEMMNGASHSSATATHKAKTTRAAKVNRQPVAAKAKAGATWQAAFGPERTEPSA